MRNHASADFRATLHLVQTDALEAIRTGIHFLDKDKRHTIHDKVAGDWDYEELMGALLLAEQEIERLRGQYEGE